MRYIALAVSICALLWSCGSRKDEHNSQPAESVVLDSVSIHKTFFNPADTSMLWCDVKVTTEYPTVYKDNDAVAQLNALATSLLFGEKYSSHKSLTAVAEEVAAEQYNELYTERIELSQEELLPTELSLAFEAKAKVIYNENNFLTYNLYQYTYTGGAHGMYSNTYHVIYLPTMTPLTLAETIIPKYLDELNHLLVEKLTANLDLMNAEELVNIGYFDQEGITATDNFYIDNNGITWVYNPYEIGCYAIGETSISLTYDEIGYFIAENSPLQTLFNTKRQ